MRVVSLFLLAMCYVLLVVRRHALPSASPRSPTPWRLSGPWCTAVRGKGGVDCFFRTTGECRWSIYTSGSSRRKAQALSGTAVPELFLCMHTWSLWGAHCVHTHQACPPRHKLQFRNDLIFYWQSKKQNEPAQPFQLFFFKIETIFIDFFLAKKVLWNYCKKIEVKQERGESLFSFSFLPYPCLEHHSSQVSVYILSAFYFICKWICILIFKKSDDKLTWLSSSFDRTYSWRLLSFLLVAQGFAVMMSEQEAGSQTEAARAFERVSVRGEQS